MQVSVESQGNLGRRVTLSLPADRLQSLVDTRLKDIQKNANIKGFRPGKVPANVINQRFGDQVRGEAIEGLLREGLTTAIRDNDFNLAGNPSITPVEGSELDYIADIELMPEFGDVDVTALNVTRNTAEVTDADIDTMINNLQQQRRTWKPVERGAQEGDLVGFESFSTVDGTRYPEEGFERNATAIGSNVILPELEEGLKGLTVGESKTIPVAFPEEWRIAEFAGKTVDITVDVKEVSEPVLPEVNEGFIRSFGVNSGDMDQFRTEIRGNLERELKGALMQRLRRAVGDQLIEKYQDVEMPPRLVEQEARSMVAQVAEQARQQGQHYPVDSDAHLGFLDSARKRVLVAMLVGEVARKNDLRLDGARVNETINLIASTYENPQQVIDLYAQDRDLLANVQNRVMEEQVIDWIAERAQHNDVPLSFSEAIAPSA